MKVKIYAHGERAGCVDTEGHGGWAALIQSPNGSQELFGEEADATKVRMELAGVVAALESIPSDSCVEVYTASKYIKKAITKWMPVWIENNWRSMKGKPVKERDLWVRLLATGLQHKINWRWVSGHAGNLKDEADRITFRTLRKRVANLPALNVEPEFVRVVLSQEHFFEGFCDKLDWTIWTPHCELEAKKKKMDKCGFRDKIARLYFEELVIRLVEDRIRTPESIHPETFRFVSVSDNGSVIWAKLHFSVAKQLYAYAKTKLNRAEKSIVTALTPFPPIKKVRPEQWEAILAACIGCSAELIEDETAGYIYSLLLNE